MHTQNSFQTEYYREMGFDPGNIIEVPQHNIDFSKYSIGPEKEGFSVAFLGRLTESKGIDLLINVANMNPDILFHVIGKGHLMINSPSRNVTLKTSADTPPGSSSTEIMCLHLNGERVSRYSFTLSVTLFFMSTYQARMQALMFNE